ncbi:hypothetical protein PISMIDRAFT_403215 [Pisolithus microcarpus 441]|uniref:Unplaced genomic scaffold scaffold_31, whole genome shotgun sequence n=1 Tax=Pisolithus microcarpus 441 TaxID=765257 RepID=A0A0C9ZY18_9AGAM|nr:hypothetical protein PISMIDRAFT_403215 [Pisolithus microcarpus 441]
MAWSRWWPRSNQCFGGRSWFIVIGERRHADRLNATRRNFNQLLTASRTSSSSTELCSELRCYSENQECGIVLAGLAELTLNVGCLMQRYP